MLKFYKSTTNNYIATNGDDIVLYDSELGKIVIKPEDARYNAALQLINDATSLSNEQFEDIVASAF